MTLEGAPAGMIFPPKDPHLRQELQRLWSFVQQKQLDERGLNNRVIAEAIARHLPEDMLLNLERYFLGERDGKRLRLTNDQNKNTLFASKGSGSQAMVFLEAQAGFTANYISSTVGATLSNAGVWTNAVSSRRSKRYFLPLDEARTLRAIERLPIRTWEFKKDPGVRRLGPVVEDFRRLFKLGPKHTTVDGDIASLALYGVQCLLRRVKTLEKKAKRC